MEKILSLLLLLPIVRSQLLQFRPNAVSFTANAGRERELECRYLGTFTGSLSLIGPAVGSDRAEMSGNGVTRYVLTIRDVQISDAGVYTCYHTSGEEVGAELIVIDDPEFLDVPLEQSLIEGSDAVVQCPAYLGHPPATLQWFKDNSEILSTPGSRFSVETDGLHIENVGMQDRGEYRCLLERQGWGIQFRDITVDVQPASPCIDKSEHPLVEVLYNEAATIDCMLMTGCAAAEVWWVRPNGAVVREQTLHLEAPHTPGIYSCFARNDNGDDRYDVTLDIRVPPLPPTSERTVSFNEGQTVMLSADLDMAPNPAPSHLWRSAGEDSIPVREQQREQRMYVTAEGRLVIRDVTLKDAGTYHCTVQNQHGMSVQTVTLQVMANPSPTPATVAPKIDGCGGTEDEDQSRQNCPQGSDRGNMLVPVVVTLSVVCVVVILGAVTAAIYCRRSRRSLRVAGVEHGPHVVSPIKPQVSLNSPPYGYSNDNMEPPVLVTTPCPFPHPSYPAGPFHQQPLTPQPRSHKSPQ